MLNNKVIMNLIMTINSLLWAGNFIAIKIATEQISSKNILFFRFLLALLVLTPFILLRFNKQNEFKIKSILNIKQIIIGIILFLHYTAFTIGIRYTTSINGSIIISTTPIFSTLFAYFILKENINKYNCLAIIFSVLGVIIIITKLNPEIINTLNFNKGDLIMLTAPITSSLYFVYNKKYSIMNNQINCFFSTIFISFMCSTVLVDWNELFNYNIYTIVNVSSLIYTGVISTALAMYIYLLGIKKIGVASASVFMNMIPVFNIVLSIIILKENFYFVQLLGSIIIISSLFLNLYARKINDRQLMT